MSIVNKACLVMVLCLVVLWAGCGDYFRPVVLPIPPIPPNPRNAHAAFVISDNGPFNPGTGMQIDVSGDTNVGVASVGRTPVHGTIVPGPTIHIAVANANENPSAPEDSVSIFTAASTASSLGVPNTVTLAPGSAPVFVTSAQNGVVYVAGRGTPPNVPPSLAVISTVSNAITQLLTLAAGSNPVALAELPNAQKVYIVEQGNNSVVSLNVVDNTLNSPITDPSINSPVWAVARSDSARVYVLSQGNGNVAVIDPSTDTLLNPGTPVSVGPGANFMLYDNVLDRLYVTNPVAGTVTILNASADPPGVLATINLTTGANAQCSGCTPLSVAALPDGTRAYVASLQLSGTTAAPVVTVINALSNTVKKTITLAGVPAIATCAATRFRLSIAAAGDSTRVYVGNCDGENVTIIRTSDDSLVFNLPAPVSAASPPPGSTQPPPQSPVFVFAGP